MTICALDGCSNPIPPERLPQARYCTNRCRYRAYRLRRSGLGPAPIARPALPPGTSRPALPKGPLEVCLERLQAHREARRLPPLQLDPALEALARVRALHLAGVRRRPLEVVAELDKADDVAVLNVNVEPLQDPRPLRVGLALEPSGWGMLQVVVLVEAVGEGEAQAARSAE